MTDTAAAIPADLSFEDALKRLETIVSRLESGQAPLEESIALYEEGAKLKAHCEARLKAALKANMARRKAQARSRAADAKDLADNEKEDE